MVISDADYAEVKHLADVATFGATQDGYKTEDVDRLLGAIFNI